MQWLQHLLISTSSPQELTCPLCRQTIVSIQESGRPERIIVASHFTRPTTAENRRGKETRFDRIMREIQESEAATPVAVAEHVPQIPGSDEGNRANRFARVLRAYDRLYPGHPYRRSEHQVRFAMVSRAREDRGEFVPSAWYTEDSVNGLVARIEVNDIIGNLGQRGPTGVPYFELYREEYLGSECDAYCTEDHPHRNYELFARIVTSEQELRRTMSGELNNRVLLLRIARNSAFDEVLRLQELGTQGTALALLQDSYAREREAQMAEWNRLGGNDRGRRRVRDEVPNIDRVASSVESSMGETSSSEIQLRSRQQAEQVEEQEEDTPRQRATRRVSFSIPDTDHRASSADPALEEGPADEMQELEGSQETPVEEGSASTEAREECRTRRRASRRVSFEIAPTDRRASSADPSTKEGVLDSEHQLHQEILGGSDIYRCPYCPHN
jgi:hypothetical protein